jgi:hypothetical protein
VIGGNGYSLKATGSRRSQESARLRWKGWTTGQYEESPNEGLETLVGPTAQETDRDRHWTPPILRKRHWDLIIAFVMRRFND